jgi:predicted Zn finger-like uncharacterized protein
MTLATTCPECGTSFKVIPDQLKLRRGLVRCGVCRHVFSGLDGLRYIDDAQDAAIAAPPAATDGAERGTATARAESPAPAEDDAYVLHAPARRRPVEDDEPLPLRDEAELAHVSLDRVDEDDFRIEPHARDAAADADSDFLAPRGPWWSRRPRVGPLALAAVVVGVFLLTAQSMLGARYWIADRAPALGPGLMLAAGALGLPNEPPRDLDALTIESFELQASGGQPTIYAASAILRNRSAHAVRWPAMELSLTDDAGSVVARKVLLPADYLRGSAAASVERGIPRGIEAPIRIGLEMPGLAPSGYKVNLFYP